MLTHSNTWPPLPLDSWRETYATLHMWTQVVGKICLALTPPSNHFWNIAFRITPQGFATPLLYARGCTLTMTFDFIEHQLVIVCSDGRTEHLPLAPQSVAAFYSSVMATLARMGIEVKIWPMPVEIPEPIRFEQDTTHHDYDPASAHACWQILLNVTPVLEQFRGQFIGKSSPVHFFWGSFDLAVTRFSGRPAPERPGADVITREAYSHEVASHGFWPGGVWPGGAAFAEPAFYAYAAPEPPGFKEAVVRPAAAFYSTALSEFLLPYEAVRLAADPAADLTAFLQSTYDAAADLGGWDRASLERRSRA